MKRWIIISILVLFYSSHSLASSINLDYRDLSKYIKTKNKPVQAQQFLVKSNESQTNYLVRSFLPKINVYGGIENFKTRNYDAKTEPNLHLKAELNLFNSGRDVLKDKINKNHYEISKLNLKNKYLEELTMARFLFADCLFYQNQLSSIKSIIKDLSNLNQKTNNQYQAGLATITELNSIEIYYQELLAELILIEEEYEHSLDELKVILGIDLSSKINLQQFHDHQNLSIKDKSFQDHPLLKTYEKEIEISHQQRKKYQFWWAPSIDLVASYDLYPFREREYFDYQDRDEYVAGVQVKIPLFDRLSSPKKAEVEKFKSKALALKRDHFGQELKAQIRKLEHGIKVRDDLIHRFEKTLQLSKENINHLQEEFLSGLKNSTDIISAFQSLLIRDQKYYEYTRDYTVFNAKLGAMINHHGEDF